MRHVLTGRLAALTCVAALAVAAANAQRTERPRQRAGDDAAPKVGEKAPLLKLKVLDGEQQVDLKEFADKKPVVLFFGSYT